MDDSYWRSRQSAQLSKPSRRAAPVRTSSLLTSARWPARSTSWLPAPSTLATPDCTLTTVVSAMRSASTRTVPGSTIVTRACGVLSSKSRSNVPSRRWTLALP